MLTHDDFALQTLVEERMVTRPDADRAKRYAAEKGVTCGEALVALQVVSERALALVRAQTAEVPFVDPAWYDINLDNTRLLSKSVAESLEAFPLLVTEQIAMIGMSNPTDLRAVDQLRSLLRLEIEPVLCERRPLLGLIERAYGLTGGAARARTSEVAAVATDASEASDGTNIGNEPIVAAVNQIIAQGVELGASDIHIGPDEQELHLRYRVDGALVPHRGPTLEMHPGLVQRLKVMATLDLTQTRRPQDGKFRFTHNGRTVDIRLSLIPTVAGENVVMRVLSTAASIRGFQELGFPAKELAQFEDSINHPHGMVLVTGPTGSGKTTTLYTALKRMNSADLNIMTIEDPVEIRMPLIRQVQVNSEIGMTFAGALRSILRQDPDVVFVGEIRDEETARTSLQAALTGHLVLSSLHTNDAAGAIPRLRDLGCPNFAINAALLCVIAQRLVRRVCPDCAAPCVPESALLRRFGLSASDTGFRAGRGCPRCANLGVRGRTGVYELLSVTSAMRTAIDEGAGVSQIRALSQREGMRPMWMDGLEKARVGVTTLQEVADVVALQSVEGESAESAASASSAADTQTRRAA